MESSRQRDYSDHPTMRYEFGELSLDTEALQLRCGEAVLHLAPKAMELLIILIVDRHRVVPKKELYDRLWQETFVVDGNLAVLIGEIRTALGDHIGFSGNSHDEQILAQSQRRAGAFGHRLRPCLSKA